MRYEFIRENTGTFSVRPLCRVMRVSTSAYYAWCKKPPVSGPDDTEERVRLRALFSASRQGAGSRTLVRRLREEGIKISRYRVMKLMKEEGLECQQRRVLGVN